MGSELDKLFRDKLKNMEQSPPQSAWPRVQRKIRSVPRLVFGLNIAAALLILLLGFWNQWKANTSETIIEVTTENRPTEPMEENEIVRQEITTEHPREVIAQTPGLEHNKIYPPKSRPSQKSKFQQKEYAPAGIVSPESNPVFETKLTVETKNSQETTAEPVIAQLFTRDQSQGTVIIYSADEVNAKFLKKPNAKSTPAPKTKVSTAQKISSIAVAIKNNEVGLGDLRQLKDDLLAFDFADNQITHSDDK